MTRILTSAAGQQYAVDDEFEDRLSALPGFDMWDRKEELYVEGYLADLLDFLTAEGMI